MCLLALVLVYMGVCVFRRYFCVTFRVVIVYLVGLSVYFVVVFFRLLW